MTFKEFFEYVDKLENVNNIDKRLLDRRYPTIEIYPLLNDSVFFRIEDTHRHFKFNEVNDNDDIYIMLWDKYKNCLVYKKAKGNTLIYDAINNFGSVLLEVLVDDILSNKNIKKEGKEIFNMRILNQDRGTGKTTMLIHTSYTTGYPIIVPTRVMGDYIKSKAKQMGLNIPEPILFSDKTSLDKVTADKILIDELGIMLDEVLAEYFNKPVKAATMTIPVTVTNPDLPKEND